MFDCIIAYKESMDREFKLEKAENEPEYKKMDALVRGIEDINRVDLHFHELIEELFGCDVNDIEDHNTDAAWLYSHKLKYTQKEMDDAVNKVQNRTVQLENSKNLLSSKLSRRSVMFFIIGISLGWLIFN